MPKVLPFSFGPKSSNNTLNLIWESRNREEKRRKAKMESESENERERKRKNTFF